MENREELMISEAAARFGLSRATLLYYDRIGVCGPSSRNAAGYRFYRRADIERLAIVVELRKAGVPLKRVSAALRKGGKALAGLLIARLGEIGAEIEALRFRQERALDFLERVADEEDLGAADLESVLEEAGIEAKRRRAWHDRFRASSPGVHDGLVAFLRERAGERRPQLERFLSGKP
jgi:DNA-binding transcriptional MerR regulator